MAKYQLDGASNSFQFAAKVKRSYEGPASDEYIRAANGRMIKQWHLELIPLWPFRYADPEGVRRDSVNLPQPGMPVRADTALVGRYQLFKNCGYDMPTEQDWGKIEGHIFMFVNEEREFGRAKKQGDFPLMPLPDDWTPTPDMGEVTVLEKQENTGNAGGADVSNVDVWPLVAAMMSGKAGDKATQAIMLSGNVAVQSSREVLSLAQTDKGAGLIKLLVEKGLGTEDKGVFSKA